MQRRELLAVASAAAVTAPLAAPRPAAAAGAPRFAYVGTYTRGAPGGSSGRAPATGIALADVDPTSGALRVKATVPSDNPSFLALHPNGRWLYAINEVKDFEGKTAGSVEAYAIDDASGALKLLNRRALSGPIPAHLAVDPGGTHLVVALYTGAAFDVLPIAADGSLGAVASTLKQTGSGPNKVRQEAPHPHAVTFDPQGRYIAAADLGTDKVLILALQGNALERVSEVALPPGAGPRHVAFHPSGKWLYVINELSSTITGWSYDPDKGTIGAEVAVASTVPAGFPDHKSTAEILVHPSGRFLYGSNRKFADHPQADAIVGFKIDEATGALSLIEHTTKDIAFPRAFQIDPTGAWLYACNQKGDTIVQHRIDAATGKLTPTGNVTETPTPVCLVFKT